MPSVLEQLMPYVRVTRVSSAFAAVGSVWFVVLWSRRVEQEAATAILMELPLWGALLSSAAASIGLFGLSACMNDLIDARRDRAYGSDRPIATGRVSLDAGAYVAVLAMIVAAAGAAPLGSAALLLTLGVAVAILIYHVVGRFVPAIGLAMVGAIVAGQMMVPNVHLRFMWPVWLVVTHTLLTFGLAHVLGRKVPPLSARAIVAAIMGWLAWSAAILWLGWHRSITDAVVTGPVGPQPLVFTSPTLWPQWVPLSAAIPPAVSALLFCGVVARKVATAGGRGPRLGQRIVRYGTAWLPAHAAAWMIGIGAWGEALLLGVLTAVGVFGMTTLREAYALSSQPVGYRL